MHWLVFAFLVIVFAANIHIFSKFQAGNITPDFAILLAGFSFFAVSTGYFALSGQNVSGLADLSYTTIGIALAVGAFWALAQVFVILMYNANAPLSIALPFVRSGAVILGVAVGILFFKEQINALKMLGIVMGIIALFLIVRG